RRPTCVVRIRSTLRPSIEGTVPDCRSIIGALRPFCGTLPRPIDSERSEMRSFPDGGAVSVAALRRPLQRHDDRIWGPPEYTNWLDESMSWKESCYIGDWSFIVQRHFSGSDSLRLFSDISLNTMSGFQVGQS